MILCTPCSVSEDKAKLCLIWVSNFQNTWSTRGKKQLRFFCDTFICRNSTSLKDSEDTLTISSPLPSWKIKMSMCCDSWDCMNHCCRHPICIIHRVKIWSRPPDTVYIYTSVLLILIKRTDGSIMKKLRKFSLLDEHFVLVHLWPTE